MCRKTDCRCLLVRLPLHAAAALQRQNPFALRERTATQKKSPKKFLQKPFPQRCGNAPPPNKKNLSQNRSRNIFGNFPLVRLPTPTVLPSPKLLATT
jgi:hypothetical protein